LDFRTLINHLEGLSRGWIAAKSETQSLLRLPLGYIGKRSPTSAIGWLAGLANWFQLTAGEGHLLLRLPSPLDPLEKQARNPYDEIYAQ